MAVYLVYLMNQIDYRDLFNAQLIAHLHHYFHKTIQIIQNKSKFVLYLF